MIACVGVDLLFGFSILVIRTEYYSNNLFLFSIVDKILQTSSVSESSADAAVEKDMIFSDKYKWPLKTMPDSDGHEWKMPVTTEIEGYKL